MSQCNTTCPYCGVGCGVTAEVEDGRVIAVSGDKHHPANSGQLCVKGTALAETLDTRGRLDVPHQAGQAVSWDAALDTIAARLSAARDEFGPDSIAFYLSGQLLTEDYYVANKLMKGFLGSANVDTNSRLCMSSAVAGYKRAFGEDLVPCTYDDLEVCDLLVMVGSNAAWTHPVLYQRIAAAKAKHPNKKIVVVDTRRTATCDIADLHLQIKPGSDAFLFTGLLKHLSASERLNQAYIEQSTQGLDATLAALESVTDQVVLEATGVSRAQLKLFYTWFAETESTVTFYSQGVNQSTSGTDKCSAIINVHLATGRIGKPGAGPFSITGQPNAMGGREVGGLSNQLAAHMDFDTAGIDRVSRFWGATDMATAPGLKAVDLFERMDRGEIKFVWIMATNPAVSLPDSTRVKRALARCDFVVVSDCVARTDTTELADMVLPAAGWGEKDGTVTNSERMISRQRKLVPAYAEAKPDWWMVTQVARRLGFARQFNFESPASIFREHAALSAFENGGERAFDIGALQDLDEARYDALAPVRWPVRVADAPLSNRQFFTDNGRARMIPVVPQALLPSGTMSINTGRVRDQWHTMTRTGKAPRLTQHSDYFTVTLGAVDAQRLQLEAGQLVEVSNEQGSVRGILAVDDSLPAAQIYLPIHWNTQFTGDGVVCALIPALVDPVSGQPQLKYAAVEIRALPVKTWGLVFGREQWDLSALEYWSRVAVNDGFVTFIAGADQSAVIAQELAALVGGESNTAHYVDAARGDYRSVVVDADKLCAAFFLTPNRQSLPRQQWMAGLGSRPLDIAAMLSGMDHTKPDVGQMICSCWEVGEKQILAAMEQGADSVEVLGDTLQCGTQCGSCVPELKRLLVNGLRTYAA